MKRIFTIICAIALVVSANAQKNEISKPSSVDRITSVVHVSSIASRPHDQIPADLSLKEAKDKRSGQNKIIIGKDPQKTNDYFTLNRNKLEQVVKGKSPSLVFDAASSNSQPTDPALAVGPNHVLVVFNTGFRIFNKSGNPLTGQLSPNPAIFPSGGCCDLTVSYDGAADRWVLSFLNGGGAGAQIAVSDGPDPVNDGWYIYNVNSINDYQKLSVWWDGYYMTDNTGTTNKVYALERDKMLVGDNSAQVVSFNLPGMITSGFHSPQALNISDDNYPTAGGVTFVYMQDDAWAGVAQDHIKIWTLDMDWNNTGNSTMSAAQTINITPFIGVFDGGAFANLPQPNGGATIDALQATIMNQAQFRKFGSYNSALFNFVVDTDASAGKLAGIRWIELRQANDTAPWTLHQEGTYTSTNGKHAWNASLIMDVQGNIGMGYTAMGGTNNKFVGMYYTGRFANDPAGTMSIAEEIILEGNGNIPGLRYGDYSKIDVDPSDDKTFWFADEMMNSGRKDVVGVFKIAPDTNNDVGVVSIDAPTSGLLGTEAVTVTIFNYGNSAQSNIPVSLSVNGSVIANETYTGTLASGTSAQYTFTTNADFSTEGQVYNVESCTTLTGDEDNSNDCTTQDITHIFHDDIGVTAITAPFSNESLGSESITVTIENFGSAAQFNFSVSYTINGGTPVTETVPGPLAPGTTMSYTFTAPGDFSSLGNYDLSATTSLPGDVDTTNDATSTTIRNISCIPIANNGDNSNETGCNLDGIKQFVLGTINVDDGGNGCNTEGGSGAKGYADRTHLSTDLNRLAAVTLVRIRYNWDGGNNGPEQLSLWIDFNDNGVFEPSEQLISGATFSADNVLVTFTFSIPNDANLGSHTLRARVIDTTGSPGDVNDPCADYQFGETHDYTVNITDPTVSVDDNLFDENDFVVSTLANNQFNITANSSEISEYLTFTVTNMIGQTLLSYNLDKVNGKYEYDLDMSYATPGVYIVRLGNAKYGNSKKIIVR